MSPRFEVPEEQAIRVMPGPLLATASAVFERLGIPLADARLAADVLVSADLRAVDSHGVSGLLRSYVTALSNGETNPKPDWKVVREGPAVATVDCDRGLGVVVAPKAMELAVQKAKVTGVGMVAMRNGRATVMVHLPGGKRLHGAPPHFYTSAGRGGAPWPDAACLAL